MAPDTTGHRRFLISATVVKELFCRDEGALHNIRQVVLIFHISRHVYGVRASTGFIIHFFIS